MPTDYLQIIKKKIADVIKSKFFYKSNKPNHLKTIYYIYICVK